MTRPQRKPRVAIEPTQDDTGPEVDGTAEDAGTAEGAGGSDDAVAAEEQPDAPGPDPADAPDACDPNATDEPDATDGPDAPDSDDGDAGQGGEEWQADDDTEAATAPRLDGLADRASGEPHDRPLLRRSFDLNRSDDDDDDDAAFGPKLAAWLQAYRERQASNGAGTARTVRMLPARSGASAPDDAEGRPHQSVGYRPPVGPGGSRLVPGWANRAQAAYADMVAASTAGSPPDWIVAGRPEPAPPQSGRRLLIIGSLALLMAGTAAAAFVVAARQAGVEPSIATALTAFTEPGTRPAPAAVDAGVTATGEAELERYEAATVPVRPRVEIVPTRVVAGPVAMPAAERAPVRPAAPPAGRSTLLLPTEKRADDSELLDHPQSMGALAKLVSSDAVEAAILAAAVAPAPQALAFAPEQASLRQASVGLASSPVPALPEPAVVGEPAPAPQDLIEEPAVVGEPAPAPQDLIEEPAARTEGVRVASLKSAVDMAGPDVTAVAADARGRAPDPDVLAGRASLLLETGDIVAARLLYELAARGGSAEAALGAGLTYDPTYFQRSGVRGIEPDAETALGWYRMALGNGEKGALDEIERLEAWMRN